MQHPFPFLFQLLGSRCRRSPPRDEDDPVRIDDPLSGSLEDGPQPSPHPIPDDGVSQSLRGDDPEAERFRQIFVGEIPQNKKSPLNRLTQSADPLEIGPAGDPPGAREFHDPETGDKAGQTTEMVSEKTGLPAVLDGVTLVVDLCTLGDETLAAFLAAALDQVTTGFGGHAGTEAVLAFAGTLRWLIGPFHLFRLKKMSHFSKTRHPNDFAVRTKIPRRTRSRSLKPKNCQEGRNDKFTTGNVNGTSAPACFSALRQIE